MLHLAFVTWWNAEHEKRGLPLGSIDLEEPVCFTLKVGIFTLTKSDPCSSEFDLVLHRGSGQVAKISAMKQVTFSIPQWEVPSK
eukprot:3154838-Lingulodinium_polyedra.AAC.1